jgi:hypothetical protein
MVRAMSNHGDLIGREDGIRTMMMPHTSIQRDMTSARRGRFERPLDGDRIARRSEARRAPLRFVRVQVGYALIGAGSWLSGERVDGTRPSAHRPV